MKLSVVAIDDEPPALELTRSYLGKIDGFDMVASFDDPISGLEFLQSNPVELLFIDINMPDISGLDLVRSLPHRPMVIFTTAHRQFAVEGFELDAVDYLLKPISFDRFAKAAEKAKDYHAFRHAKNNEAQKNLFVYSEYRMIRIELSSIEYIESLEDYVKIHLDNEKPVMTLMTLKGILEKLPSSQFQRIHRSYIVATAKVRSLQNRKAKLQSGIDLPVSDSYSDFIKEWQRR